MTEWKKIDGYNYEVSNTGEIRNIKRNTLLKKCIHDKRYYRINLANNGANKSFLIHRLVAEYFCEKHTGCDIIHHLDNNGFNNSSDNLIWTTQSFNVKMAYFEGYAKSRAGKNNPNYKHGLYTNTYYLSQKKKDRKRVWRKFKDS